MAGVGGGETQTKQVESTYDECQYGQQRAPLPAYPPSSGIAPSHLPTPVLRPQAPPPPAVAGYGNPPHSSDTQQHSAQLAAPPPQFYPPANNKVLYQAPPPRIPLSGGAGQRLSQPDSRNYDQNVYTFDHHSQLPCPTPLNTVAVGGVRTRSSAHISSAPVRYNHTESGPAADQQHMPRTVTKR